MRRFATVILVLFFAVQAHAQFIPQGNYGFRLGLTAHPTFGWIKGERVKGNGLGLGFSYGLMGDFNFAENYSFTTGLTVTTLNGKSTELDVMPYDENSREKADAYDLKYRIQYLELPITLKLKTAKVGLLRWYGQFGLSNGIRLGAKQDASRSPGGYITDGLNINDGTAIYRAGLIIGGGAEYDIDRNASFTAGLTLNNGFTDITTDRSRNVRNHYVSLNLGVFF
ncbi:PorT family protein [Pedobacter yulinensis]|uniref:PorT family protein n=1 Tax=Pedobacter yulinensis TaxID=2126353 RepID=A0A2T3HNT6_9SPHI|nr:porin family protein [Pedobacter yulinensis]PST84118.1 PorT family protein [Pedobacter yulinensis]